MCFVLNEKNDLSLVIKTFGRPDAHFTAKKNKKYLFNDKIQILPLLKPYRLKSRARVVKVC